MGKLSIIGEVSNAPEGKVSIVEIDGDNISVDESLLVLASALTQLASQSGQSPVKLLGGFNIVVASALLTDRTQLHEVSDDDKLEAFLSRLDDEEFWPEDNL